MGRNALSLALACVLQLLLERCGNRKHPQGGVRRHDPAPVAQRSTSTDRRRGAVVRIHLAFTPREAHVTVFRATSFRHYALAPRRTLAWHAKEAGVVSIDVRAAAGDAAYLMRLTVRPSN